jgi:hypothetical protein
VQLIEHPGAKLRNKGGKQEMEKSFNAAFALLFYPRNRAYSGIVVSILELAFSAKRLSVQKVENRI